MCGGPSRGLECPGGRRNVGLRHRLGPGNTNVRVREGGTRYSTLPVPTRYTPPWYPPVPQPPTHRCHATAPVLLGHAHMTDLRSTKEILGVDDAHCGHGD